MSAFTQPLMLEYLDGHMWLVAQPFEFASEVAERLIRVPVGFVTDFASVPRFFWRVLPPTGQYGKAAVIHDYCYVSAIVDKAMADRVFLEAMAVLGVSAWKRRLMYWAVSMFGGRGR